MSSSGTGRVKNMFPEVSLERIGEKHLEQMTRRTSTPILDATVEFNDDPPTPISPPTNDTQSRDDEINEITKVSSTFEQIESKPKVKRRVRIRVMSSSSSSS